VHPVAVESVAWIAEQKNTLSAVLYLSAALVYLRFDDERQPARYAVASGLFVLALLTKTVTATLPAALLVVFWWRRGRLSWRADVLPLVPWFVVGAATGLYTAHFERTLIGAQGADFYLSVLERGLLAGRVIWFYLGKTLWPADLLFIYPHWQIDATVAWQYAFPAALAVLVAGLVWWRRRDRGPLAAFLLFTGTLFPVLGFFNVYPFLFSYVADHFQYLARLGLLALAAAGCARLAARFPAWVGPTAGGALVAVLGFLTWSQCSIYRDAGTLYTATLARNPACWMAHNNLAILLAESGQVHDAIDHLRKALELRPDYAHAENNLGDDLNRLGRFHEAVPHLERALQLRPAYPEAHYNLGVSYMSLNRAAEGIAQFETALKARPDYPIALRGLGQALATTGRLPDAIPHLQRAVELDPEVAEARIDLGFALMNLRRLPEAVVQLAEAVRLDPEFPEGRNIYGRALAASGRLDEAIDQFAAAVELKPDFVEARQNLALARRQAGRGP
jgi:protein O-mannosyl-transferase